MQAFTGTPILPARNARSSPLTYWRTAVTPCCLAKSSGKPKQSKSSAKRSRSNNPGFGKVPKSETKAEKPIEQPEEPKKEKNSGPDLQKIDGNGISLEHRLREEIIHPLRKPKQTLFGTLAFSATLGFFFAISRYLSKKDAFGDAAKNVAIDVVAIVLFAFLTWREFEFGRRSLDSIAGRPQARDLPIVRLKEPVISSPLIGKNRRLSGLLSGNDAVIVAGRRADVLKYLGRCVTEGNDDACIVAFPTDARDIDEGLIGADAVASGEQENKKDWIAWLGDAVPPRKNVALFKIEKEGSWKEAASAYVVAVGDPAEIPVPADAERQEIVEV